jgi:hypothetical protein
VTLAVVSSRPAEETPAPAAPVYLGSIKHKKRPHRGEKGTRCPDWTHVDKRGRGPAIDMSTHAWKETEAQRLFAGALVDPDTGRRFATARGIAFEAKDTNDGTWHGFPLPWDDVPEAMQDQLRQHGRVTSAQLRRYSEVGTSIDWALDSDHDS